MSILEANHFVGGCFPHIQYNILKRRLQTLFFAVKHLQPDHIGGDRFGNILEDIKYFVENKKVFVVHFRNVSGTVPYFEETLLEDGYMKGAAQLRQVGY